MVVYVIKTTHTATENNDGFKGETIIRYNGKGNTNWGEENLNNYYAKYGYSRLCDARKMLIKRIEWNKQEESFGFWKTESEIVEFTL